MKSTIELAREHASRYTNRHYPDKPVYTFHQDALQRFTALVRAAALEEAAHMCENLPAQQDIDVRDQCAAAILALKDKT